MSVILHYKTAGEITAILDDLKQNHKLRANQDFEFAFHQSRWDEMTGEVPRHTVFTFVSPALESWFALKYNNE